MPVAGHPCVINVVVVSVASCCKIDSSDSVATYPRLDRSHISPLSHDLPPNPLRASTWQATSAEKMLERVAESDADLCRTRDELQRRIDGNQGEIQTLQNEYTKLRESAR